MALLIQTNSNFKLILVTNARIGRKRQKKLPLPHPLPPSASATYKVDPDRNFLYFFNFLKCTSSGLKRDSPEETAAPADV